MNFTLLSLIAVTAILLVMLFMPLAIRLAYATDAIDEPGERSVHSARIPRLGGMAIFLSFFVACLLFVPQDITRDGFLIGLVIIALTGIVDDIHGLRPLFKFTGEIVAVLVFIVMSDTAIDSFGDLLGFGPLNTGVLAVPVTVFCVVGVINALNMSDGLDTLAGGLSLVACLFLAYFALICGSALILALVVALLGCLIGFLYYNDHPALTFMGDTGSLVLGYALTSICILFQHCNESMPVAAVSMALILALPTLDTMLVMTLRMLKGGSPFQADRTHLHHRMLALNLSHTGVVSIIYSLMFCYGLVAVFMRGLPEYTQFGTGMVMGIVIFGSVYWLQSIGFRVPERLPGGEIRQIEQALFSRFAALMERSVPVMKWLIPLCLVLPVIALHLSGDRLVMFAALLIAGIVVVFPWSKSHDRQGWVHGVVYLLTFAMLVVLNLYAPLWVTQYLKVLMLIVALWVVLKLLVKRHGHIFFTSSFELLMIFVSWFIPFVVVDLFDLPDETRRYLVRSCLEALPFLLAVKIIMYAESRYALPFVSCLIGGLFVIVIKASIGNW